MRDEELEKFSVTVDIDRVIKILTDYIDICHPKIEELKRTHLRKFHYFLLSTLVRIEANVNALIVLYPHLKDDTTFKLPINLILRSIVSDYLTIEYLLTFKNPQDNSDTSIINEITVMNIDFVKFQEAILKEELTYLKEKNVHPWSQKKVDERLHQFYSDNNDIFIEKNGEFIARPIKTFRESTPTKILDDDVIRNSKVTEKRKFDRVKSLGLEEFSIPAFLPYKYFSQFQHPTSNMDDLIMSDPKIIDFRMMLMAIDLIFILTLQIFRETNPDKEIERKIKECQDNLVQLIKK